MVPEMIEPWIDITEFASKYRISQSTIRRRIKNKTIPFKMDYGKYLIQDSPDSMKAAPLFSRQGPIPLQSLTSHYSVDTDFADLISENTRLHAHNKSLMGQVAELETLVKALEAELEMD